MVGHARQPWLPIRTEPIGGIRDFLQRAAVRSQLSRTTARPMEFLDLTLPSAAENLALDEALLERGEAEGGEFLRLWESPAYAVVVGRASRVEEEADLARCRQDGVPVLRRCSGGAAVAIGPGCLMYAVVLGFAGREGLRDVTRTHGYVLGRIRRALESLAISAQQQGLSDLCRGTRKFSGNSLRLRRSHLLYHGTLLYDFDLPRIARYLRTPPRQPEYRAGRDHAAFVANLDASAAELREAVRAEWQAEWRAEASLESWPAAEVRHLVAAKYGQDTWNLAR